MTKRSNNDRSAEIHNLVGWSNAVVDLLATSLPEFAISLMRNLLDEAAQKRDLKDLRDFADELGRMTASYPAEEQARLHAKLKAEFGRGLYREFDRGLARILKRGSIKTDDEFRLVRDQLDDQEKAEKLDEKQRAKIVRMLNAYEESR